VRLGQSLGFWSASGLLGYRIGLGFLKLSHGTLFFFEVDIAKKEIMKHFTSKTIKLRYCDFKIKGLRMRGKYSR